MTDSFVDNSQALTPDLYQRFKGALELGKWPDGRALTQIQKETCMQVIIIYEQAHVEQDSRTAYLPDQCASAPDIFFSDRKDQTGKN